MVAIFACAAAVLYGTADFLGGAASRRASAIAVLAVTVPFGELIVLTVALAAGGPLHMAGLVWGLAGGAAGGAGLIVFYAGLAAAPMSVVAPVSALVSTVLPVGVAVAQGERPGPSVVVGGVLCLIAITMVSMGGQQDRGGRHGGPRPCLAGLRRRSVGGTGRWVGPRRRPAALSSSPIAPLLAPPPPCRTPPGSPPASTKPHETRPTGLLYGFLAGLGFGLFFLFMRNAAASGVLWSAGVSRLAGAVIALAAAAVTRTRPVGWRPDRRVFLMALVSGAFDASANLCYLLATRAGLFGLAVVITSLYPGVTVLLARVTLGERMRSVQRAGLALAAVGIVLLTA